MADHNWNPDQYQKFAAERAKPFFDLLDLVRSVSGGDVFDLGCGTGELTAELHLRARAGATTGMDSSTTMLEKADALAGNGLSFVPGDIRDFDAEAAFDLIFSNAALHWVPDHPGLLRRLTAGLRPGGQLAVQVPANGDHPSHALAEALAREEPFVRHMRDAPPSPAESVLAPERYSELLEELGYSEQHVRLQVYGHHLPSTDAIVEWTRGTTLLRYQNVLGAGTFDLFLERYRRRLVNALGEYSPYFYTFKRILFWAQLPTAG